MSINKYEKKLFEQSNYTSYQTKTVGLLFNVNAEYVDNYEEELRKTYGKNVRNWFGEIFLNRSFVVYQQKEKALDSI